MDVAGYQLHRRYAPVLARVQEIGDQAARLVQKRMRERMPQTRIIVAAEKNCPLVLIDNYRAALNTELYPPARPNSDYMGITTSSASGVLVVINADAHDPGRERELDETVVHELAHAVQYSRPGYREAALRGVRHNFGIESIGFRSTWKQNRQTARDEREARALEYLARELR